MPTSQELIKKIQEKMLQFEVSQLSLSETETRSALIDPIFTAIGWDMGNPLVVRMEWRKNPSDRPVDYAFMVNGVPKLLVEAERLKENINDKKWEDQLLWYSSKLGVKWCALTNGNIIRIYNSLAEEAAADKLLFEIEIKTIDTPVGLSISAFMEKLLLLSEENLRGGKIDEVWDETYTVRKVFDYLESHRETLVDDIVKSAKLTKRSVGGVLEQIIDLRDSFLAEEQATIDEDKLTVSTEGSSLEYRDEAPSSVVPPDYEALFDARGKTIKYTGKKPSSLWFIRSHKVDTWKDLIEKLCGTVYTENKDRFEELIFELNNERGGKRRNSDEKRKYFTKNSNELDYERQIPNTDIFVETKIDASTIVRLCGYVLEKFDYRKEMVGVKIRD